jgi:MerR family redox-sensitive transcriptional activator SoxR
MYEESILERLGVIAVAKVAGFDLSEIRGVLSGVGTGQPASIWRTVAQAKQVEIDGQMRGLARMKDILTSLAGCGCATLEECGRTFIDARSKQPPDAPLEPTARRRLSAKKLTRRGAAASR